MVKEMKRTQVDVPAVYVNMFYVQVIDDMVRVTFYETVNNEDKLPRMAVLMSMSNFQALMSVGSNTTGGPGEDRADIEDRTEHADNHSEDGGVQTNTPSAYRVKRNK